MPPAISLLRGTTCYLSGPMDFVVDRKQEALIGWRARLTDALESWGVRVFDPWFKPMVRNLGRYGIEDETSNEERKDWIFDEGSRGAAVRSRLSGSFWPVMHIDLRMVDLSDFVIACCPTNLYSVGTPHEIVLARQQRKPVLLVSPPVRYPQWQALSDALKDQPELLSLLGDVQREVVVRDNPTGVPSQWYMTLVGSEVFFDGFGWDPYRARFKWASNYLDAREAQPHPPVRPLLPFLEQLDDGKRPQRWDGRSRRFRDNDDWLLLEEQANDRQAD